MRNVTREDIKQLIKQVLYDIGIIERDPFSSVPTEYKIVCCSNINTTLSIPTIKERFPADVAAKFNVRVRDYIGENDTVIMRAANGYFIITYSYNIVD